MNELIEYIKLHILSLEQDSVKLNAEMDTYEEFESNEWQSLEIEDISINGQIIASYHLLSVAKDILEKSERN